MHEVALKRKGRFKMVKAGVFLADGFEEIEGLTVVDAMRRAGYEVTTISTMEHRVIDGSHGIKVFADHMFDDVDYTAFDVIILPGGGVGTQNLKANEGVKNVVKDMYDEGKLVGAICAAPTVLAEIRILDGKNATCFPGCEKEFGDKVHYTGVQVEQDGRVITANGMAAALPFALALIKELSGEEDVHKVKQGTSYPG